MSLDFDLFISGSPNGDQRWPNNSEDLFCRQFFNLETDTQSPCDFFIEVRTSPEAQRCCYYSYVHRKDVFGLVNGQKRKGAYFAMILRFKGIYCDNPRNIFSLMDMVYRNKIIGTVLDNNSTGETYLIESFDARKEKLRDIENLFASQLSVVVNSLKPLDSSFANAQSGIMPLYSLYEKDETEIVEALKKHLKIHLLAYTNDQTGIIEEIKTQLSVKEKECSNLNNQYLALDAEKNQVDTQLKAVSGDLIIERQKNNELSQEIESYMTQLEEANRFSELHEWILEYAKNHSNVEEHSQTGLKHGGGANGGINRKDRNRDFDIESEQVNGLLSFLKKYWTWLLVALVLMSAIILAFRLFSKPKKEDVSGQTAVSLVQENDTLKFELKAARDSLKTVVESLQGIQATVNGQSQGFVTIPITNFRIDVDPITKGVASTGASIWPDQLIKNPYFQLAIEKIDGSDGSATINNHKLSVQKAGKVKIVLKDMSGKEISAREISVK